MELNARQLIALAGPLVIGYLTWSAVSGGLAVRQAATSAVISAGTVAKRPEITDLVRDPFAKEGSSVPSANGATAAEVVDESPLHLDGTVIAGRWRMAIINGARVFEGQTFRGMRLAVVASDGVTLISPTNGELRLALDIAPAAPSAKAPGAPFAKAPGGTAAVAQTPLQRGMEALQRGAGADVLEKLGIPES